MYAPHLLECLRSGVGDVSFDKNKLILMFTHDLELDSVLKTVQGYNRVLREVPINNLLSANDLAQINVALTKIFEQVRNMKNQEQIYPKPRQL